MQIRLTEFSHGAGCGCKIAPDVLETILFQAEPDAADPRLLVGNSSRDDAACYDLGDGKALISTTDFFMPIVDDPVDFGRIAASNAISDIYAMGGQPLMAIAILGWPVNKIPAKIARQVLAGARQSCREAGIVIAGGHSIDAPEPIFGLAVTGQAPLQKLRRNDQAQPGDLLYLTKPLGVGILTTAARRQQIDAGDLAAAIASMTELNSIGMEFAEMPAVHAMTDVTGFGLLGHLLEICRGARLDAHIRMSALPLLDNLDHYMTQGCVPGGTHRNYQACQAFTGPLSERERNLLCDPQTSGGLLVAVDPAASRDLEQLAQTRGIRLQPVGHCLAPAQEQPMISITAYP